MIQIKRNKFLTKIIDGEQISSIPTKVFDEITGVTTLEYAKEFIRDKDVIMNEIEVLESIRRTRVVSQNYFTPPKILIDDREVSFKKVLESWDLTYDMLFSAIKNAALFTINEKIQCDNYEYIQRVGDIVHLYIRENKLFKPEEFSPKITNIQRSIMDNSKYFGINGTRTLTTIIKFGEIRKKLTDSAASINIYSPDEEIIENFIDTTNSIYLNFSLFYDDEEWYFQEPSRESIEKILSKCREFAQHTASDPPDSITMAKILQILWHQSIQGLKSGVIVLQDIFGRKKMFAVKDLIPKPKYLLQQHMGKYLSTRTSKWREDVNNYIL